MKTQSKNGNRRNTPELDEILAKKKPGRPKKTLTADQIADSFEVHAKELQGVADILRGTA